MRSMAGGDHPQPGTGAATPMVVIDSRLEGLGSRPSYVYIYNSLSIDCMYSLYRCLYYSNAQNNGNKHNMSTTGIAEDERLWASTYERCAVVVLLFGVPSTACGHSLRTHFMVSIALYKSIEVKVGLSSNSIVQKHAVCRSHLFCALKSSAACEFHSRLKPRQHGSLDRSERIFRYLGFDMS